MQTSLRSCPCGWVGLRSRAAQGRCPRCGTTTTRTRQQRLDRLRSEHWLLGKVGSYPRWTMAQKATERTRIESLFAN